MTHNNNKADFSLELFFPSLDLQDTPTIMPNAKQWSGEQTYTKH